MVPSVTVRVLTFAISLIPAFSFVLPPQAEVFNQVSKQAPLKSPSEDSISSSSAGAVILWHGLGDSSEADGLASVADLIKEIHPGTYVHIISVGEPSSDRQNSWFGDLNVQLDGVCETLAADKILTSAPFVDAIGFSQGGQFLRGYQERCGGSGGHHSAPSIRNLLTFGSQHNGIAEFQKCKGVTDFVCQAANALLKGNTVWSDFVQHKLVPAQYYRNSDDYENYLEHSNFLADINNEREKKNATYAENLAKMEKFVMLVFEEDQTVIPRESGWFAQVDMESGNVTSLRDREIYKEDWVGLKKLDQKGGLVFESIKGGHMQLDDGDLKRLFKKYLGAA